MKIIDVNIGEVRIGRDDIVLKTILGSCVGIAFLWREKNIYGLAHCLLPKAPEGETKLGGKFVDQAIHSLITLMQLTPDHFHEVQIFVTGGGTIIKNLPFDIGKQNILAARSTLKSYGFKFKEISVAGDTGQYLTIDSQQGLLQVKKLSSTFKEFSPV